MINWEELYYYNNSRPCGNDLEKAIEKAKVEFESHKAPYIVKVYDNVTKQCVFYREK